MGSKVCASLHRFNNIPDSARMFTKADVQFLRLRSGMGPRRGRRWLGEGVAIDVVDVDVAIEGGELRDLALAEFSTLPAVIAELCRPLATPSIHQA
jgi:hypothetical protein